MSQLPNTLSPLSISGAWFLDDQGRRVRLRGVNLGGDCKVPYPDGGTNHPTDFADHAEVSFIGRPFPLEEADEHFGRLAAWGFNCVRLLTTWEAVEHAGPGEYDEAYLEYFRSICEKAGEYGLYVFVDFHQDAWSRMSGGDGAPGWTFAAVGLDFTLFDISATTHVMQYKYDYDDPTPRQEKNYPTMTWSQNYRMPANAIMWTLFFGGNTFTPNFQIEGQNVQDYLQGKYLGAMCAVAERLEDLPHVLGFDTLNEPSTGYIGKPMSYRHLEASEDHPARVAPGPAWSPIDGLAVSQGVTHSIPQLGFDPSVMAIVPKGEFEVNEGSIDIWLEGHKCPFQAAGAYHWTREEGAVPSDENFFTHKDGRKLNPEADFMVPFFNAVADAIRGIKHDWMIFAELDPFRGVNDAGFPKGMPARTVNASHWYDIITLATKTFQFPTAFNPLTGKTYEGAEEIEGSYAAALGNLKEASHTLPEGDGPTLVGEFGIPYDLEGGAAYEAWAGGDHSEGPWTHHTIALDLMYNALDTLQIHSTQWNYTASNSNDLRIGDGWNQEDLSIFSKDQQADPEDVNSGGRALKGFVRPYMRVCAGTPISSKFDRHEGICEISFETSGDGASEIYIPSLQYPDGFALELPVEGVDAELDPARQVLIVTATSAGRVDLVITRPEAG